MLFFFANETWYHIELTLSKKGKKIYKYLLIDYDQRDFSRRGKRTKVKSPILFETEMMPIDGQAQQGSKYDTTPGKNYGSDGEDEALANHLEMQAPMDHPVYKRRKIDFGFHLICACVGIYFTMVFSNWTGIYGFVFTASDVIDNTTVWVRFGGNVTGLAYILIIGLINLLQRSAGF